MAAEDNATQPPNKNVETSPVEDCNIASEGADDAAETGVLQTRQSTVRNTANVTVDGADEVVNEVPPPGPFESAHDADGVHGAEPTEEKRMRLAETEHSAAVDAPVEAADTAVTQADHSAHEEHVEAAEKPGEEALKPDDVTEQTAFHVNKSIASDAVDAPYLSKQETGLTESASTDTSSSNTPASKKPRSDASPSEDGQEDQDDDSDSQSNDHSDDQTQSLLELGLFEMRSLVEFFDSESIHSSQEDSPAETEWKRQKRDCRAESRVLDTVMKMVGREEVKQFFLTIRTRLDEARAHSQKIAFPDLNLWIVGEPGCGKHTVVTLYVRLLREAHALHVINGVDHTDYSGDSSYEISYLNDNCVVFYAEDCNHADFYSSSCMERDVLVFKNIQTLNIADHRHQSQFYNNIRRINHEMTVFVAMGRPGGAIPDLESSPYHKTTFLHKLILKDYSFGELVTLACRCIMSYDFQVEGGWDSKYLRVAIRRLLRAKESEVFGNVHAIRSAVSAMIERHVQRVTSERKSGKTVDIKATRNIKTIKDAKDMVEDEEERRCSRLSVLSAVDILGPRPSDTSTHGAAWKELQSMVGLEQIKDAVRELQSLAGVNYDRAIQELEPITLSLNRVFLGPPGTGKTTTARLYGLTLVDMGLLSSNEVVYKTPSDFISENIGGSEAKTRSILMSARGKVLIIDDAHTFFYGATSSGRSNDTDSFRLGILDTLVSLVDSKPGADQCVLLLGYPDHMREMFQKANPGLRRRFPLEDAFVFENYDDKALTEMLDQKMKQQNMNATPKAREVAAEVLRRSRERPNFGNGGDVENLLSKAKATYRARQAAEAKALASIYENMVLQPQDFDKDYDRDLTAPSRCDELFRPLVGFASIRDQFRGIQQTAVHMRRLGKDPRACIPFTYIFKGPPGTGKTHTARILGQIFYDMGFLSTPDVIDTSATGLVGMYLGHTGPKVIELFDRALGKVLFIDEAYRLGTKANSGGTSFQEEAVGEIVDCLTKPRYARKLIVVLAGYQHDMELLLRTNAGLRSRFAAEVSFPALGGQQCYACLRTCLRRQDVDIGDHDTAMDEERETVMRLFQKLGMTYGWANARDVETLAQSIVTRVYEDPEKALQKQEERHESDSSSQGLNSDRATFAILTKDVIEFMKTMLKQRIRGGGNN